MITVIEIIMLSSVFSGTPLAFQRRNSAFELNEPLDVDGRWFAEGYGRSFGIGGEAMRVVFKIELD